MGHRRGDLCRVAQPVGHGGRFQQPFSLLIIPCYLIAGPVWIIAHDYKLHLWGWTLWRVLVVLGTAYAIIRLAASGLPAG